MRIVVVDDEKAVLHGLRYILTKHRPDYEIAGMVQSAEEALRLLEQTAADAVVTDVKMPGMNGVELTREIKAKYPDISVVILSGYADFEYVRQALKDGAFDYLLKPCHYRTVIDILRKIEEKVEERGKKQERRSRKQLLLELVGGKLEAAEEWAPHENMQMAVLCGEGSSSPLPGECIEQHIADWREGEDVRETVVLEGNCIVLFREAIELTAFKEKLQAYRQQMRIHNYKLYASVYAFKNAPGGIAQAYSVCSRMNEFMRFNELSAEMDYDSYAGLLELQKEFSVGACLSGKELGKRFVGADAAKMRQYVESALRSLYGIPQKLEPVRVKRELLSELVYMEHLLKEHGGGFSSERQMDFADELKSAKTLRELWSWLKSYLMSSILCMNDENKNPHYIQSAVRYIELNYMKDLSLQIVAEAVYLNPWYFSTQFKKHANLSFSEYLNVVRVRMAKDFLRQKDLKVYQVAEMVGFQDAAYFSTVFKSLESMSPKEFQQMF